MDCEHPREWRWGLSFEWGARGWMILFYFRMFTKFPRRIAFGITKSCSNELNYGAIFGPSASQRVDAFVWPSSMQQQIGKCCTNVELHWKQSHAALFRAWTTPFPHPKQIHKAISTSWCILANFVCFVQESSENHTNFNYMTCPGSFSIGFRTILARSRSKS